MNTVIVGIEDTEEARDALKFARLFADAEGAELHVVSVYSDSIFYMGQEEMEGARNSYFDRMREFAESEIDEDLHFFKSIQTSVPRGLTEAAEELEAGAIVIGSSHMGPIGRVLMGDAGARLVSGAACPVIVVPRGWSKSKKEGFGKIGVGYDAAPESGAALTCAKELAETTGASLELIGVVPAAVTPGRGGFSDLGYWDLLKNDLEKEVADATAATGLDGATGHVRAGFAADELAEASIDLDLLVLGSRSYGPVRRTFLGGTSVRVMRSSACPVIVVPRTGE
ncbi:MAG: universal stress protein [Solirubrobacterales bacterium]